MGSAAAVTSLLHPAYGSAARDIRAAVGVSPAARLDRVARQLDGVRRAIVLRDRHFRGIVIQQAGAYLGTRITPDHQQFVGVDCPDGSITFEQGADTHEITMCVDVDAIIELVKAGLLADTAWLEQICNYCDTSTPPPPWPT